MFFPALANVYAKLSSLASTAVGLGASMIGIQDVDSKFTSTNVEGALKELGTGVNPDVSKINIVNGTYQVLVSDVVVVGDKATPFNITLPVGVVGQRFNIKNVGVGTVTLLPTGTETIDGDSSQTIYTNESVTVICYSLTKWAII